MAISDKLLYLNGTKQAIKNELNKFGSNITENDTFRSYSNVINDIYDKLPKVSGNGSDFSLENVQNGKLDSFGMDGNTEQTTYSGKNLFNIPDGSIVNQGVTVTRNNNVITFSGTATGTYPSTGSFPFTIAPGTYTISSTNNNYDFFLWFRNLNSDLINSVNLHKGTKTITITSNNITALVIGVENLTTGTTYNIETSIQIEQGSTATSFEPYVGGTPSPNPDYPQEVKVVENEQIVNVTGKNLAYNFANIWYSTSSNTFTNNNNFKSCKAKAKPNTTYTISKKNVSNRFVVFTSEVDIVAGVPLGRLVTQDPTLTNYTFTTQNNENYIFFGYISSTNAEEIASAEEEIMIEEGSTATTYEPYQSQDYEIDLGDIELCKIDTYKDVIFKNNQLSSYYDNTLDEDSWYIKKEIGKVVLDGSEDWSFGSSGGYPRATINSLNDIMTYADTNRHIGRFICSHFTPDITNGTGHMYQYQNTILCNPTSDITSLNAFKTWLNTNKPSLYYVLATPTYEKITNSTLISQLESIETFTGLNNFSVSNENNVLPTLYVSRLKELGKLE